MFERVILGITTVDKSEHVVTGRYSTLSTQHESELVEVIEAANSRLAHTAVDIGDPLGRIAVFSRFITKDELDLRRQQLAIDPLNYEVKHLKAL